MSHPNETIIYSIFGQIESAVARVMLDEGKVRMIEARDIPLSAAFNDEGQRAYFAIIISRKYLGEFDYRVEQLRA